MIWKKESTKGRRRLERELFSVFGFQFFQPIPSFFTIPPPHAHNHHAGNHCPHCPPSVIPFPSESIPPLPLKQNLLQNPYRELFLLIGAAAALVGPKDLPRIARAAGRLAGQSIGYVQLARRQFDNVMQQSQAHQVHKDLQDALAQIESIHYEVRNISLMNPGPLTRKLMDNLQDPAPLSSGANSSLEKPNEELKSVNTAMKDSTFRTSDSPNIHSQATAYAKLSESDAVKTGALKSSAEKDNLYDESGLFIVLPISAESTGMLPNHKENGKGSDLVLEAVVEA